MGPLTESLPKPMLTVAGKTLLEHKFDALPDDVRDIILVIGYYGEKIRKKFGDNYHGRTLRYVTQKNIVGGTADALWQTREYVEGKFFVLMGDDIYAREDLEACRAHEWAILVERVPDTSVGGRVVIDANHDVVDIIEGNDGGEGAVSTNLFVLDARIFDFPQIPKAPGSSELGLPQTVLAASKAADILLRVVEATRWIQISNPTDLALAEGALRKAVQ
jgi:bifunctional UDP-N-acetylglucosamine pyrophosphorylase/glucosamine-1-phosphate N-acetyltransferase